MFVPSLAWQTISFDVKNGQPTPLFFGFFLPGWTRLVAGVVVLTALAQAAAALGC